jgi:hypothetical protein
MKYLSLLISALAAALIEAGCATTAPYNPFKISQDEFYSRTKIIALAPVTIPQNLEDPEPVKAKLESLIEAKLRGAGFAVVPSRESMAIWKRMTEQVGGLFDPATGQRDESKFKVVRDYTLRELNTKFNVDAWLHPHVLVARAPWSGVTATWHGTTESIRATSELIRESLPWALLGVGVTTSGTIPALSLAVRIEDVNGVQVYSHEGGIQVLAKISGRTFVPVPRDALFANEERTVAAVNMALDSLIPKEENL